MKCCVLAIAIDAQGTVQDEEASIVARDLPEALCQLAEKIRRGDTILDTMDAEILNISATTEALATELERKARESLQ